MLVLVMQAVAAPPAPVPGTAVAGVKDVQAISALLAGLLILSIGVSVLLRARRDRTHIAFAAFTSVVAAWHICTYVAGSYDSDTWRWIALWPAATIPPTAIAFFRQFLAQPSIGAPRRPPRVTLAWTFLAYAALIYSALGSSVTHDGRRAIHEQDWFLVPFGVYVFGGLYRCVYDMYTSYRATRKRVERARVRYLTLGGFVATTLALTDVLPRFGVAWPTVGNVLSILYLFFISQALFRSRLIDVNELLGKMAVLGSLVVLISLGYGVLIFFVGGSRFDGIYLLSALVAASVILVLFEPVRGLIENGTNRWLLRQRTELRGRLEALRRELAGVSDVPDLTRRIITALEESGRVTHAGIYLLDADGAGFDRPGHLGGTGIDRLDAGAARAFLDAARAGHLDAEALRREAEALPAGAAERREALAAVVAVMTELDAELVFPFLGTAETEQGRWLLGFLAIRDDRVAGAFDADDIEVFRALAGQAARGIEASQEAARGKERDRLAALGEMSAGLAHEIRNPLGAIKGAAQLLVGPDGRPLPPTAESGEFIDIILEEVDRLNNVVTRFLDYARADREGPRPQPIDLNLVVKKVVALLSSAPEARTAVVTVRLDEQLPLVVADPEALVQVFLNLALNAVQAMPEGGTLDILTTRRRRSRLGYGQFAEVRLRDTGVGISPDLLQKLFVPFYTTKSRGTGLGLAIAQRIVSQHAGTIEVRSTPGEGSTFSVFFPAAPGTMPSATTTGQIANPLRDAPPPARPIGGR